MVGITSFTFQSGGGNMVNNKVKDFHGAVIGYRCIVCDQIKSKTWDNICNLCREASEKLEATDAIL